MLSDKLTSLLSPFGIMGNKHALSDNYKTLEIRPDMIRSAAPFGILEADAVLGLKTTFYVKTVDFVALTRSLPDEEEFQLEIKGDVLHWDCGSASGRLALVKAPITIPTIEVPNAEPFKATPDFITALRLGGISCGDASLTSAGVYGIALDNRRDCFCVYSSDDITIAFAKIDRLLDLPEMMVLSPEAAKLLDIVLTSDKSAQIAAGAKAIYSAAGGFRLLIRPIPPMKQDIRATIEAFASSDVIAKLPHDRIADFVKRTIALGEGAKASSVEISAAQGAVCMRFEGDRASSEEYYLAKGLEVPDLAAIQVHAGRIARALQYTDTLVLDHIERGIIGLANKDADFVYYMSKRKGKPT